MNKNRGTDIRNRVEKKTRIRTEMPSELLAYHAAADGGKAKRETNYSVQVLAFRFDL